MYLRCRRRRSRPSINHTAATPARWAGEVAVAGSAGSEATGESLWPGAAAHVSLKRYGVHTEMAGWSVRPALKRLDEVETKLLALDDSFVEKGAPS